MKIYPKQLDVLARTFAFSQPIDFTRLDVYKNGQLLNDKPMGKRHPDWQPLGTDKVFIVDKFNETDDWFAFRMN